MDLSKVRSQLDSASSNLTLQSGHVYVDNSSGKILPSATSLTSGGLLVPKWSGSHQFVRGGEIGDIIHKYAESGDKPEIQFESDIFQEVDQGISNVDLAKKWIEEETSYVSVARETVVTGYFHRPILPKSIGKRKGKKKPSIFRYAGTCDELFLDKNHSSESGGDYTKITCDFKTGNVAGGGARAKSAVVQVTLYSIAIQQMLLPLYRGELGLGMIVHISKTRKFDPGNDIIIFDTADYAAMAVGVLRNTEFMKPSVFNTTYESTLAADPDGELVNSEDTACPFEI